MGVDANLAGVRARIAAACERAGRDPAGVTLVGATKTVEPARMAAAVQAGLTAVGENWVQEAAAKKPVGGNVLAGVDWHLIGHLQRNKVREALTLFDIIESVDSLRLAEELSRRASQPAAVLLEVNVAGEESKFGFAPSEVADAVSTVGGLPNIDLRGLMTVAPIASSPVDVRPVFVALREIAAANGLGALSMGMTDDFEVAVEEGATIVRVGRAIFGERPQ